jgi:hypothetical protein
LPKEIDGKIRGFRLIKVLERVSHIEFSDPSIQKKLAQGLQSSLDEYRVRVGLSRLADAAYVWPPESFQRTESIQDLR